MSTVRAEKLLGAEYPEQGLMKIQMDSTSHLNIQGKIEMDFWTRQNCPRRRSSQ